MTGASSDVFTPEQRSAVMRRIKGSDTGPERRVRAILRKAGVGYRLGGCGLVGRPDLVMKGRRIALFVHGCFWHGHDCPRGARKPKANAEYWRDKIERNRARDQRNADVLAQQGWRVITVWECDMRAPGFAGALMDQVRQATAVAGSASASAPSPDSTSDRAPNRV